MSETKGDAFTKPIDAAAFDVDAWISGIKPATKTVKVSSKGALVDQISELETELHTLARRVVNKDDEALAGEEGPDQRRVELAERIKALHEELAGSWMTVRLSAMTMGQYNDIQQQNPDDTVAAACQGLTSHATIVAPNGAGSKLSFEQWRKVHDHIEAGQFALLWLELQELTVGAVVEPDFSRAVSSILDGDGSSKS